jgi:hypothetical protein
MRNVTQRALSQACTEKDVENAYRAEISHSRPCASISSPHHTDGYFQWSTVRLLLEAKFDEKLKERIPLCNVLGQMLLYLKHFENAGEVLPNVLLVGDRNECFVLSTSSVQGFLNLSLDWTVAPSSGSSELTRALVQGLNLLPYVYEVDANLDFRDVLTHVETLAKGEVQSLRANPSNIEVLFLYWQERVLTDKRLTAVNKVDVFLRCLFQPTNVFLHPSKKNVLAVPEYPEGIIVNADQYRSFFNHFQQGYKPSEVETFYAMKDRLIEDTSRRRQGAFFTPTQWVSEAHQELNNVLGPNWREDCVVWDISCGTGNLTRDYVFQDLVLSTLEASDVQTIKDQGYNPGAVVFQHDFLNPDTKSMFLTGKNLLPDALQQHLRDMAAQNKRIVFFMNPPYAEDGVMGAKGETRKDVAASTALAYHLRDLKMGRASRQLYAQFLFQCVTLAQQFGFSKYTVAAFTKPTFMCSESYCNFRKWWYDRCAFQGGFLFNASHFADVSDAWGLSFTIWSEGCTNRSPEVAIKEIQNFTVVTTQRKQLYHSEGRSASDWIGNTKGSLQDTPKFSSGLKVRDLPEVYSAGSEMDSLGVFVNKGNNLMKSGTDVFLLSRETNR